MCFYVSKFWISMIDDDVGDDDDDDDDDDSQLASPLRRLVSVLTELASALARWPSGLSGC